MSLKAKERKLLIDGDIVAYTISAACEEATKWDDDLWTLHASEKESLKRAYDFVENYKEILFSDHVTVALSDKNNFRKELSDTYKSSRKTVRKPLTYKAIKDFFEEKYETVIYPNLEADDVLGILATQDDGFTKTIITKDKDLRTIPSNIYFFGEKQMQIIEEIDEETADYNFLKQTLMGDRVDGYSGCPTIGDKTADKILSPHKGDFKAMWDAVVKEFKKHDFSDQEIQTQARLARILRNGEYDVVEAQPILFEWGYPR
jgi:5'-3' exonuclease